ncbi:MAG TPA: hypothetical protein DDW19_08905 [Anaerolineaceae bacterium]|jgi:uncharacterized membrane protein YkoI|nr:hypothetical protein [Anaerolineaceae bacterium]
MKKNQSLILSIFITVFLVVIAGGVATTVLANNQAPKTNTISAADAVSTYQAREAEYKALLDKANQQLELANQQLTALAGSSTPAPQEQNSSAEYPVTEEMAKSIAFQVAKDYPLEDPELVNYNGTVAYEVKFKNGNIYVDAMTGQILFNGLTQPSTSITADQAVQLAVAYVGNSNVMDIEVETYNGSRVYMIEFANGQEVFVSLTGQIVAVKMPSTTSPSHETEHEEDHEEEHESFEMDD